MITLLMTPQSRHGSVTASMSRSTPRHTRGEKTSG
jgi:hypothetical protein